MLLSTCADFEGFPDNVGAVPQNTTVVLMNDTHWYWWYVRIVGTNYEQFIPADLLEFPQEKVARYNMIANETIDLIAGDKSYRFCKASKKAKKVRFSPDLYYEPEVPELTSDSESDISLPSSPVAFISDKQMSETSFTGKSHSSVKIADFTTEISGL